MKKNVLILVALLFSGSLLAQPVIPASKWMGQEAIESISLTFVDTSLISLCLDADDNGTISVAKAWVIKVICAAWEGVYDHACTNGVIAFNEDGTATLDKKICSEQDRETSDAAIQESKTKKVIIVRRTVDNSPYTSPFGHNFR